MSLELVRALPRGTRLNVYEIVSVLGHGGFGITYMARHSVLRNNVAIKEFLPEHLAVRQEDSRVSARSDDSSGDFEWGLSRFLDEARVLARFNHDNVVRVHDIFEANNTAYMVMKYERGKSLSDYLKASGPLSERETKDILVPILGGLKHVHQEGFLHRDIKPANIIIRDNGVPVLIDFGAARNPTQNKTGGMTRIFTEYYAPVEQCFSGKQGPWTDLYALGAVAYKCLTGETPPLVNRRMREDPLVPLSTAAKTPVSRKFAAAIEWALRVHEEDRPQSVDELLDAIAGKMPSTPIQGESRGRADQYEGPFGASDSPELATETRVRFDESTFAGDSPTTTKLGGDEATVVAKETAHSTSVYEPPAETKAGDRESNPLSEDRFAVATSIEDRAPQAVPVEPDLVEDPTPYDQAEPASPALAPRQEEPAGEISSLAAAAEYREPTPLAQDEISEPASEREERSVPAGEPESLAESTLVSVAPERSADNRAAIDQDVESESSGTELQLPDEFRASELLASSMPPEAPAIGEPESQKSNLEEQAEIAVPVSTEPLGTSAQRNPAPIEVEATEPAKPTATPSIGSSKDGSSKEVRRGEKKTDGEQPRKKGPRGPKTDRIEATATEPASDPIATPSTGSSKDGSSKEVRRGEKKTDGEQPKKKGPRGPKTDRIEATATEPASDPIATPSTGSSKEVRRWPSSGDELEAKKPPRVAEKLNLNPPPPASPPSPAQAEARKQKPPAPDVSVEDVEDTSPDPLPAHKVRVVSRHWYFAGAALALLIVAAVSFSPRNAADVPAPLEQIAWGAAVRENTIVAFGDYLKKQPDGSHVAEAQTRIEAIRGEVETAWNEAQGQDTAEAYTTFLTKFARNEIHVAEAQDALRRIEPEEVAWLDAMTMDTVIAYENFIRDNPNSRHLDEANARISAVKEKIASIEYQVGTAAIAATTAAPCENYLKNYPRGQHVEECRKHIDELNEQGRRDREYLQKLADLGEYNGPVATPLTPLAAAALRGFQGKNSLDQSGIIDASTVQAIDRAVQVDRAARVAYADATQKRLRANYEAFLTTFASSRYAADVRSRIAQCRTDTRPVQSTRVSTIQQPGNGSAPTEANACPAARSDAGNKAVAACIADGGVASVPNDIVPGNPIADPSQGPIQRAFNPRFLCTATSQVQCTVTTTVTQSSEVCP